jgi:hypothetical protein
MRPTLVAGIDDDGLARLLVAQNGAVALQRADGKGLDDHGSILGASELGALRLRAETGDILVGARMAGFRNGIA